MRFACSHVTYELVDSLVPKRFEVAHDGSKGERQDCHPVLAFYAAKLILFHALPPQRAAHSFSVKLGLILSVSPAAENIHPGLFVDASGDISQKPQEPMISQICKHGMIRCMYTSGREELTCLIKTSSKDEGYLYN